MAISAFGFSVAIDVKPNNVQWILEKLGMNSSAEVVYAIHWIIILLFGLTAIVAGLMVLFLVARWVILNIVRVIIGAVRAIGNIIRPRQSVVGKATATVSNTERIDTVSQLRETASMIKANNDLIARYLDVLVRALGDKNEDIKSKK